MTNTTKKHQAKRIDIVSIKMVKEKSVIYKNRKITSAKDVVEITRTFLEESDREKFIGIFLNTKNEPNCIEASKYREEKIARGVEKT